MIRIILLVVVILIILGVGGCSVMIHLMNERNKNYYKYATPQGEIETKYTDLGAYDVTQVEYDAKSYATGRKNFLFHNTARGARSAAIIMSLIETAKLNEINPEEYLTELITHSQEYINDPAMAKEYLPWSDKMQKTCGLKNGKAERTEPIQRN